VNHREDLCIHKEEGKLKKSEEGLDLLRKWEAKIPGIE
jgi:hypothetical protein